MTKTISTIGSVVFQRVFIFCLVQFSKKAEIIVQVMNKTGE